MIWFQDDFASNDGTNLVLGALPKGGEKKTKVKGTVKTTVGPLDRLMLELRLKFTYNTKTYDIAANKTLSAPIVYVVFPEVDITGGSTDGETVFFI